MSRFQICQLFSSSDEYQKRTVGVFFTCFVCVNIWVIQIQMVFRYQRKIREGEKEVQWSVNWSCALIKLDKAPLNLSTSGFSHDVNSFRDVSKLFQFVHKICLMEFATLLSVNLWYQNFNLSRDFHFSSSSFFFKW